MVFSNLHTTAQSYRTIRDKTETFSSLKPPKSGTYQVPLAAASCLNLEVGLYYASLMAMMMAIPHPLLMEI
jgi:hypothetical protein